ncbi:alpha-1,2-mannosidase [Streptomyces sp. NBC_01261]|uniref:alpha-1,2-mannosidase n=1 Tax=unclassified Streptomyces TaxID=2593676 RepID=UPI002E2BCDBF|nr:MULTISPECIES: alpha-1,2-mannosidase [unclassified Streptomyces]
MDPVFADFSTHPAQLSNAVVVHHRCGVAPSHLALAAGGYIRVDFTVGEREESAEAVVRVTTLDAGAPVDVLLNGKVLAEDLAISGVGVAGEPQATVLTVPGELLSVGDNVLEIRNPEGAEGLLRLRAFTVDPSHDQERSERALAERSARRSVVAFNTEVRALGTAVWQSGPRLLFHVDCGERSLPAHLAWRGADGSEADIGLPADVSGFLGHRRSADGTVAEYRGRQADRWTYPEGTAGARLHRFSTEEGHDDTWTPSGELRLLLDDGGAPVERVTWTDRQGTTVSLTLGRPAAVPGPEDAGAEWEDITRSVVGVEASDEFDLAGEVAENLLSRSRSKWLANDDTAEVDFTLDSPAAVVLYRLTSANDAPDRDPEDWQLQGSHDGRHWTTVDTRTGERFKQRHETKEYSVSSPAAYARYRLDITGNQGSDQTQLSRIQFLTAGAPTAASNPVAADFTGYRIARGGAPVGYRGTSVPGPWSETQGQGQAGTPEAGAALHTLLAGDLGATARGLDDAARLIGKLAAYLNNA